ncbi:SGNH/GDSL hydrolase family protein [Mastigocoleus sp. MO_188.B34]|uniref:SGNH/GDSL hydrolase family protein n=1 Tax=Mastigocoleus sp. MO_188.B34 TaxID=3036635 RepID=UPI002632C50D|nr:SGNH/GDSL hydrolase family protein [Mastigocoleus sp. MO_188.B34]MDJ0698036.1 SGNH/GDSL hydrolase family protein [Mastigocoleus sp. MO_188.B34]
MHQRSANLNYQNRQLFDVTSYNDNKSNNLRVDYASTSQNLTMKANWRVDGLKVNDLKSYGNPFFHHNENKLKNNFNNSFDDLVIFGDSYSDTGNAFHLSNNTFPPSPPYFEGRLSNGPIWVDQIASELSLQEDDIQNFAFAGATSGREVFVPEGTNIIAEEPGFTSELPGLLDQVDQFADGIGQDGADPNDIYFVWMNGNDFQLLNSSLSLNSGSNSSLNLNSNLTSNNVSEIQAAIAQYASNISAAVTRLANLGAEKIAIPNISNFGLLPKAVESGASLQGTLTTLAINYALADTINNLERNLGLDIIEIDVFGFTQAIVSSPQEFGFSNISDPLIEETSPENPDEFLFWDGVHFTTQAQGLFADLFKDAITTFSTNTSLKSESFSRSTCISSDEYINQVKPGCIPGSSMSSVFTGIFDINELGVRNTPDFYYERGLSH